jgi:hypothetical protein
MHYLYLTIEERERVKVDEVKSSVLAPIPINPQNPFLPIFPNFWSDREKNPFINGVFSCRFYALAKCHTNYL